MPRTKEQNEEIRDAAKTSIIDNSLRLFAKKGFHGTSISDIAKNSKISKGLIYNYFHGKEEIMDSILNRFFEEGEEITFMLKGIEDPYEQIQTIIDASFSMLKEKEEEWRFLSAIMMQPETSKRGEHLSKNFNKLMIDKVKKIFRKMELQNPKGEALIFAATIDGLILYYLIDKENYPLNSLVKQLKKKYSREEIERKITS